MSGELHVQKLGKSYRKWGSEWRRVASWFVPSILPREERWVLKDVTFSVSHGEAVGIVGQNGAGKSTLLKLITGTTRPTQGQVLLRGSVAAILELGMGFHPDLTGRQNAFHSAGLRGYSREDIEHAMPKIEDFAEIGEYFDQPTRTYSSGMQVRVAFATVTAFRPEILIVDEALSVGDAYFQHKSFARIREFREQGTTLLIVSHSSSTVKALCDRAILLDKGRILKDGTPEAVMDYYNALLAEKEGRTVKATRHETGKTQTVSGTGEARVEEIGLFDCNGNQVEFVNVGESVELRIVVRTHAPIPRLVLGYMIKDRLGQAMYGTNTHHTAQALENVQAGEKVVYTIRFEMNLGPGSYSISTALVSSDTHLVNNYEWKDLAHLFAVSNLDKTTFVGSSWMEPVFMIERDRKSEDSKLEQGIAK